jgi:hypothetical protein
MNKEIKDKWLKALRSGEYKQGRLFLRATDDGVDSYCCLGVLANECLYGKWDKWEEFSDKANDKLIWSYNNERYATGPFKLPNSFTSYLDIKKEDWVHILSGMNDSGKTFEEIADWIEENL